MSTTIDTACQNFPDTEAEVRYMKLWIKAAKVLTDALEAGHLSNGTQDTLVAAFQAARTAI